MSQRRARIGSRHALADAHRVDSPVHAARAMFGLHSTDAASVYLAARARTAAWDPAQLEAALYDDHTLVRVLGMRRTMWVVPRERAPALVRLVTDTLRDKARSTDVQLVRKGKLAPPGQEEAWIAEAERRTLDALARLDEATGAELAAEVPMLASKIAFGEGTKWAGQQSMVTRIVWQLSMAGYIVRGRPRGSWTSSQYRWVLAEPVLRDGCPDLRTACRQIVRGYLERFGPATLADVRWWTGLTAKACKGALAELGAVDTPEGLVLADDRAPLAEPDPWVALLPALDPTPMGWKERDAYLDPDHVGALFDRSGNVGPTIWSDGRIVGGWAVRDRGEVVTRLLADVGAEVARRVDDEAQRLQADLAGAVVKPRFRTPLEKALSA